jgi:UDP-N-acetylmuramyl pentapeptide synthase
MAKRRISLLDFGSPLGRRRLLSSAHHAALPILVPLGSLYRRTLLRRTRLVAVVGSYGKTTTTYAVRVALGLGHGRSQPGNVRGYVARALLQLRPGLKRAVLEVAIDGPDQMKRLAQMLRPDITVVTSIGSEHHRSLKTLERTRDEKAWMVRVLTESGLAVLNGDDEHVGWMAKETSGRVVRVGFGEGNDLRIDELTSTWPDGTQFRVHYEGTTRCFRTGRAGRHFAFTAAAALVVARKEGIPWSLLHRRMSRLRPLTARLEPVRLSNGVILLRDERKSSLETIHAALDLLAEVPAPRKILVLGDVSEPPGSQGPIYREIGRRSAEITDFLIVIGGSVRRYISGARRAGMPEARIHFAKKGWREAFELLQELLQPGDLVMIKGRDTQRFDRLSLMLQGLQVSCLIPFCQAPVRCPDCPMLTAE